MKKNFKIGVLFTLSVFAIAGIGTGIAISNNPHSAEVKADTPPVGTKYTKVTSTDNLEVGANYALVGAKETEQGSGVYDYWTASTTSNSNNRKSVSISVTDDYYFHTNDDVNVLNLELGGKEDAYTFKTTNYEGTNGYLASASSDNYQLRVFSDANTCTISFNVTYQGAALITLKPNESKNRVKFNYNNGTPIFSCYGGSEEYNTFLFKAEETGPRVLLDKTSLILDDNSNTVTATTVNIISPTFAWSIKEKTGDCIELTDTSAAIVTITPKPSCKYATATVQLRVEGTNIDETIVINKEVTITKKPSLSNPFTVSEALTFIGTYKTDTNIAVKGIVSYVESYSSKYESIYYYISDNGLRDNELYVYSGKGYSGGGFSSKDDLSTGLTVLIKGTLKEYNGTKEFDYNSFLVVCAENYSSLFLNDTGKICSTGSNDNFELLKAIWEIQGIRYNSLSLEEKAVVVSPTASENVKAALERYDYIIGKYNTGAYKSKLEEYIGDHEVIYEHTSNVEINKESVLITAVIAVISVISLIGVSALVFVKKRKHN